MMTEARMSVINVMPDTGFVPTMAIALAATVVNRKAMTATTRMPTTAYSRLKSTTPTKKNTNVAAKAIITPMEMIFIEMSRCVRFTSAFTLLPLPFSSFEASPTALLMMPHDFTMPMMPAMAMPPMPM